MTLRINPSGVRRYLGCRYAGYVHSVLGLRPSQRLPSPHQDRGKAFHALVEFAWRYYAKEGTVFAFEGADGRDYAQAIFQKLYDDEGTVLDEVTCEELLEAARFHLPRLNMSDWEVVHVGGRPLIEADLRAPLFTGVELQAKVDIVLRHKKTGLVWLIDWKTTNYWISTVDQLPYLRNDYQLVISRWVLEKVGVKVDCTALVKMRTLAPQPPALTAKTRKVSVNKSNLACDWETFRDALIDNGEDPGSDSAQAVCKYLRTVTFDRWIVDVTDQTSETRLRESVRHDLAPELHALKTKTRETPPLRVLENYSHRSRCGRCDYQMWCEEELSSGTLPKHLLGVHYKALDWSPLAGQETFAAVVTSPHDAYIRWAAEQGRSLAATEEFRP